ncbi:MAG: hypothetical protein ACRDSR_26065 [Pseudonocardiaceae bacterium]
MGAPDTSGIDLDNVRCRADLVFCLRQLRVEAGRPSYSKLNELAGNKLRPSTLSDLIGEKAETRSSQPEWETVRLFVRACGVPEADLEGWWAAWKATVAPNRPAWQEEQQRLTADLAAAEACTEQLAAAKERIDQLTAAVEAAEANAKGAEAVLAAYHQSQSAALCLPKPLDRLRRKADAYHEARDYAAAVDLYSQIATHVEREHGPDDPRTLQAQHRHLEVETEASWRSRRSIRFRVFTHHTLNERWQKLIRAHQHSLPEGSRTTLELRLDHIYWVATLFMRDNKTTKSLLIPSSQDADSTTPSTGPRIDFWFTNPRYRDGLSPARKLLIGLYADCKNYLSPDDPFTAEVVKYMHTDDLQFERPERQRWETRIRLRQQARNIVFQYGDATT